MLLTGAGLMVRSFMKLYSMELGINIDRLLVPGVLAGMVAAIPMALVATLVTAFQDRGFLRPAYQVAFVIVGDPSPLQREVYEVVLAAQQTAKVVCQRCPVIAECLADGDRVRTIVVRATRQARGDDPA